MESINQRRKWMNEKLQTIDRDNGIDVEFEEAVIGFMVLVINGVTYLPRIKSHHFYEPDYRIIHQAILELSARGHDIDMLSVKSYLKNKGEKIEVIKLINAVNSYGAVVIKTRDKVEVENALIGLYQRRELIKMADEIDRMNLPLPEIQERVIKISAEGARENIQHAKTLALQVAEEMEIMRNAKLKGERLSGVIHTNIPEIDKQGGFKSGDLIIIAARPAMGKTTLARWITMEAANMFDTLFLTKEMTPKTIIGLMACTHAELYQNKVSRMDLDDEEYGRYLKSLGEIGRRNIHVEDLAPLFEMAARMRAWRMKTDITREALVVVDYLQLISVEGVVMNDVKAVTLISRTLKELAVELNVVMIALSQLSRAVEQRGGDKRPVLSDLRDSGSIEQDADQVIFLYRPEYYGFETNDEGDSTRGMMEAIRAKYRGGPTGTMTFYMNLGTGRPYSREAGVIGPGVPAGSRLILPPAQDYEIPKMPDNDQVPF